MRRRRCGSSLPRSRSRARVEFSVTKVISPAPPRGMITSTRPRALISSCTDWRVLGIEQFDCAFGNAGDGGHDFNQALVAAGRFFAAAQDDGVAGLQREDRGIDRDVRARFVDDADHAERHAQLCGCAGRSTSSTPRASRRWDRASAATSRTPRAMSLIRCRSQQQAVAHRAFEAGSLDVLRLARENASFAALRSHLQSPAAEHSFLRWKAARSFRDGGAGTQQLFLRGCSGGESAAITLSFAGGK